MSRSIRATFMVLPFAACLLLQARSQTIRYTNDVQAYSITYDEQKLKGTDMARVVWLSPWYAPDTPGPFFAVVSVSGQPSQPDKMFIAPPLEFGLVNQNADENAFEANAKQNLSTAEASIQSLKTLTFPAVLEPVRRYLLDGLAMSLEINQLREAYIQSGDVDRLRRALCQVCNCDSTFDAMMKTLREADSFSSRGDLSRSWSNKIWECYKKQHQTYPVASWQAFLDQYGVSEKSQSKAPE